VSALDPLLAAIGALPPEAMPHAVELLKAIAPSRKRLARLSRREAQVLGEMARGAPYKVIGWNLGISRRTVEIHAANILVALDVRTREEAIRLHILGGNAG
jgi:two-component system, LuxR family, response regulator FixJ